MYEEIDMLFHHGYRTRVLMNLIDQIQMYGGMERKMERYIRK